MRRAFLDDAVPDAPSPAGATSEGHPTDGDVARGINATAIGAFYFYMVQEAIVTVIERAGLVPSDDPNQFRDAILALLPSVASFATQAWVRARIADLVDSSPGALDTLNELAAALGDDANFSATIMGLISARPTQADADARYAQTAGDTFTGPVRGPKPPDDDNSARLATTNWVRENAGGVGNLAFFSLAADWQGQLNGGWADVLQARYTPSSAARAVGIVLTSNFAGQIRIRRGAASITPAIGAGQQLLQNWDRQLFVDEPTSAAEQTYTLQAQATAQSNPARVLAQSHFQIFELPAAAEVAIAAADIDLSTGADYYDIAAVTIVPPSVATKMHLRFVAFAASPFPLRLRRGAATLFEVQGGALNISPSNTAGFPSNYEDWVDSPGTTNPVTYTLQTPGIAGIILAGSYLLAVPA